MAKSSKSIRTTNTADGKHEIRPGQSELLLQELHVLTREGKLNQDSRRKLKQIYHLYQFIEPLLNDILAQNSSQPLSLVDHGAGKSYLGFILYDLFFKKLAQAARIIGVETRSELVEKSQQLADKLGFSGMEFINLAVADSISAAQIPAQIDIVTALHACNTATDDALDFALAKAAKYIVIVPCCQAEVAACLKAQRNNSELNSSLRQLWRQPIHSRELGSHLTNVLRCLRLEASGYSVTATELIGWEHSMKNELIIAKRTERPNHKAATGLIELLTSFGLHELAERFQPQVSSQ